MALKKKNLSESELIELYKLAEEAKNSGDYEKASNCYEKILQADDSKWEPDFFYNYYCSRYYTPIYIDKSNQKEIEDSISYIISASVTAVNKIAADSDTNKLDAITEMHTYLDEYYNYYVYDLQRQADDCRYDIKNYAESSVEVSGLKTRLNLIGCMAYRISHLYYDFADTIASNKICTDSAKGNSILSDSWKKGNHMIWLAYSMMVYPLKKESNEALAKYTALIRVSEPDYQPPVLPENKKSGCYIATCVYGSYDCPEVWVLRRYRDERLAKKSAGRLFIRTYYAVSPKLVRWFGSSSWFKKLWKPMLDKMTVSLKSKGFNDTPYQDK